MIQQQSNFNDPLPQGWQNSTSKNYPPFALIEGSETWSHAIVKDISRLSGSAWRQELRPGDDTSVYGSYRAEITITSKGTANQYRQNALRFSTYVPSGVWASSSAEEIFPFQQHPWASNNTGGSPSLAIEIKSDAYRMVVRYTSSGRETMRTFPIGPAERDTWVDWIVYYQPHTTNGQIIIWRRVVGKDADYKIAQQYTGPCLHSWSEYPFLKMGIYKWNNPDSGAQNTYRIGYIDEVAFGTSTPDQIVNEFRLTNPTPPPNEIPIANAGPDQYLLEGATETKLDGEGTDPEGGILTPLWELIESPAPAVFNSADWNPVITGLIPGKFVFKLTVTDPGGLIAEDVVQVFVPDPPAPPEPQLLYQFLNMEHGEIVSLFDNGTWTKTKQDG